MNASCTNPWHGKANPKIYARGLCMACYKRLCDRGTLRPAQGLHVTCSVDDCDRRHVARGYCKPHWRAWKLRGDPLALQPWGQKGCSITGCTGRHKAKGLCNRHYGMARRIKEAPIEWGRTRVRYPAAPLHDLILRRRASGKTDAEIATDLGLKCRENVSALLQRSEIREADADRYATALGLHMDVLWPPEEVAA